MKRSFPVLSAVWVLFAGLVLASACKKADPRGVGLTGSAAPSHSAQTPQNLANRPPPKSQGRTTSGEIAMGNLDGQIGSLEQLVSKTNPDMARRRQLIDLLSLRGDMAGRIADIERAAEMAERLPLDEPDKPQPYLTRASMRAALHRFDDAWKDLDEAERLGAKPSQTRSKRAAILAARGRLDEALKFAEEARQARPTIESIGFVAALLGDLDRQTEAITAFREAFAANGDSSPFSVASLFFYQGQYWERVGNKDLAVAYYQAALERLPVYTHAAAHQARLAAPSDAEALLKPLFVTSDDPELHFVLAMKLQARGDAAGAKVHVDAAAKRYDELMGRHPAAFADHAAQFWLDAGGDAKKAFDLAKVNLQSRKTPKAYELAVITALAGHDRKAACEVGTEGLAQPHISSMLREIVKGSCEER